MADIADLAALALTFAAAFVAGHWGYAVAGRGVEAGPIWRQVLACLLAYKAFLAVILGAWLWRRKTRETGVGLPFS